MTQRYKALRGTRDILPREVSAWQYLEHVARSTFDRYGFREIRTPLIEPTALFTRSVGESSDIVRKEMYTFERGSDSMTLRPESTASVVRAFVEHSLHRGIGEGYPERYFYIGPMFRHERPQKGRQRQFHQIGVEVLGACEPLVDAETIQMVDAFLEALGISDRSTLVSSVGDENCRPAYREALRAWLEPRLGQMCEDCNRRAKENPLRVLDCKVDADQRLLEEAPVLLDMLCDGCAAHFDAVCGMLDAFEVDFKIERRLVRGLDYYRRTVFEVVAGGLGAQNAVLGGGRYDGLVEELGGPAVPGFGFALGMERVILLLDENRVPGPRVDLALIALGQDGWTACIPIARRMREAGLSTMIPVVDRPMGAQLRRATKAGARFAMFVGKDELAEGRFGLKEMSTGEQVSLDEPQVLQRVRESDGTDRE